MVGPKANHHHVNTEENISVTDMLRSEQGTLLGTMRIISAVALQRQTSKFACSYFKTFLLQHSNKVLMHMCP